MTAVDPGPVRLRADGLSSCKVGGELVVLDLVGSQYFIIHGCGILLFELLQEKRDREELVTALLTRFEVGENMARRDVDRFLSDLSSAGLLSA